MPFFKLGAVQSPTQSTNGTNFIGTKGIGMFSIFRGVTFLSISNGRYNLKVLTMNWSFIIIYNQAMDVHNSIIKFTDRIGITR